MLNSNVLPNVMRVFQALPFEKTPSRLQCDATRCNLSLPSRFGGSPVEPVKRKQCSRETNERARKDAPIRRLETKSAGLVGSAMRSELTKTLLKWLRIGW